MKKSVKITAAVFAAGMAFTIAGCDGCAGCAGCSNTSINKTVTRSNWFTSTSYSGIQSSFIEGDVHFSKEEIIYDVTYNGQYAKNSTYSVEYKDGVYSTEFYATTYDWNSTGIPDNYKNSLTETVYYYKTQLDISVRFIMKSGEESEWFADSVVTESYFRTAENNLKPLYSKQVIKSTSPAKLNAESLSEAYKKADVTYENFYNRKCDEVTSITKNAEKDAESKIYSLKKLKNSLFDNSSLYIAARGLKLTTNEILTVNQRVNMFSAADGGVCDYTMGGIVFELGTEERKSITAALAAQNLYTPKTSVDQEGNSVADPGVTSVAVAINNVSGVLSGTSQYVWFAAVENADNNVSRATMLKMTVPLSYNLGSLNYTLKEVKSTLWNG